MAVVQNECYRLVTIGYLKKLIEQSGSGSSLKSLIQKSDGTYQGVGGTRDDYCPTYGELSAGTYVQAYSAGTTPNSDRDGLVVNTKWKGDGTTNYAVNQCVDRADVSVRYTRISGLQLSVGKHIFDGCGESGTSVSVSNTYNRKTKSMSGCAADEGSIAYSSSTTEASATCDSSFTFHKSLANTVSTISCTKYDITKNTGTTERTDDVYVSVNFRGTKYDSNHEVLTQPAGDGAYSKFVSSAMVATDITVTPNYTDYKVPATCNDDCIASANTTVSLTPKGVYDVVTTYSYVQCGVDIPGKGTISAVTQTGQTMTLPVVSSSFTASGSCSDEVAPAGTQINIASKNVTVTWSGLTLTRTFLMTATTKHCESPKPVLECCQINGPMTLTCSGVTQFEIGKCGCQNVVDLGLPSGRKWGRYPLGTDENYSVFKYYVWGHTIEATTATTTSGMPQWEGDKIATATSYPYDTDVDNNSTDERDAIVFLYPDSGYRMPTKAEAQELLAHTTQQWTTDYKGIAGLNGWVYTSIHNNETLFFPAAGELYPPDDTHSTWFQRDAGYVSHCWTRTGRWIQSDNCAAYRIVGLRGHEGGDCFVPENGSSRKYGCLVIPVCDKG